MKFCPTRGQHARSRGTVRQTGRTIRKKLYHFKAGRRGLSGRQSAAEESGVVEAVLRTVVADGPTHARPRYHKGTGNLDTATRTRNYADTGLEFS